MERRIAIPVDEDGMLNGHFGHSRYFAVLNAKDDQIVSEETLEAPPHKPGRIPRFLADQKVTDVLVRNIGEKAEKIFEYNKIHVFKGAPTMPVQELAIGFLAGTVEFLPENCGHHHHHDHHHEHHHEHHHGHHHGYRQT